MSQREPDRASTGRIQPIQEEQIFVVEEKKNVIWATFFTSLRLKIVIIERYLKLSENDDFDDKNWL